MHKAMCLILNMIFHSTLFVPLFTSKQCFVWLFWVCFMTLLVSTLHSVEWWDGWWNGNNSEGSGGGLTVILSRNLTRRTGENSVRTAGVPAQIRKERLPNTNIKRYHYRKQLDQNTSVFFRPVFLAVVRRTYKASQCIKLNAVSFVMQPYNV
jgi:hypothetical protein